MAKASTLVSALYQTWDIDHHKAIITPLHHTKDRLKRGERIVCYFWPRAAYGGQQARLTCVGSSNYSNICQQLELQPENYSPAFLTLLSQQRETCWWEKRTGHCHVHHVHLARRALALRSRACRPREQGTLYPPTPPCQPVPRSPHPRPFRPCFRAPRP